MLYAIRYAIYRFKYLYGKSLSLKAPVDVSLELSASCNQFCGYCYHASPQTLPFKRGKMSLETATNILWSAHRANVPALKFNYRGEATLNKEFFKIVSLAEKMADGSIFMDRILNSNFKFPTDKEEIFQGLSTLTKVKVSFDSFIKDVFERQRAGGDFDRTLANIDKFYNKPGRKTELVIQAVRTKLNADEDLEGEIKKRWSGATASIRDMVSGRVDKDLSDKELKPLPEERQSCIQAHSRLIFDWEGNAQMCCPDIGSLHRLGNISGHTVKELFNSKMAVALRKNLKDKSAFKYSPCLKCPSFESYKGYKAPWKS